jgi:sporulation protein YlmC with PRC-barrel domain
MNAKQTLCLSDLVGKKVIDENGAVLGRVHEIRTNKGEVTVLICGARALLQRMAGFRTGTRVKWEQVRSVGDKEIVCDRRQGRAKSQK